MREILLLILSLVAVTPLAQGQTIERYKKVMFSNIAPGELEGEMVKNMPAKITFSSESGAPYAGIYVRIFNASGIAVFKYLCEKPWLLIKLPEGDYNIVAVDRKKVQRMASFRVKKEGEGQTVVKLKWPRETVGY